MQKTIYEKYDQTGNMFIHTYSGENFPKADNIQITITNNNLVTEKSCSVILNKDRSLELARNILDEYAPDFVWNEEYDEKAGENGSFIYSLKSNFLNYRIVLEKHKSGSIKHIIGTVSSNILQRHHILFQGQPMVFWVFDFSNPLIEERRSSLSLEEAKKICEDHFNWVKGA